MFPKTDEAESKLLDWAYLQSKESYHLRGTVTRRFKKLFPHGHKTSIRPYINFIGRIIKEEGEFSKTHNCSLMNDIHVDAIDLLIQYGTNYVPFVWSICPPTPDEGHCCRNSWMLAIHTGSKHPLIYVEGVVLRAAVAPMLHAWNAKSVNAKVAIDWTHYTVSRWSRYLGIPFTVEEHEALRAVTSLGENMSLLFHKKYFTQEAKELLIQILERRRE